MQSTDDYRLSHLERGRSYDATLAETPFDAYMAAWERQHLARIVGRLFPTGVGRYLDFACGTGRVTSVVAPLARESVGVDISPSMLEAARERCKRRWRSTRPPAPGRWYGSPEWGGTGTSSLLYGEMYEEDSEYR